MKQNYCITRNAVLGLLLLGAGDEVMGASWDSCEAVFNSCWETAGPVDGVLASVAVSCVSGTLQFISSLWKVKIAHFVVVNIALVK